VSQIENTWTRVHSWPHHNTKFWIRDRVACCLHFLRHVDGYDCAGLPFGIRFDSLFTNNVFSKSMAFRYTYEVVKVLTVVYKDSSIHIPSSEQEWALSCFVAFLEFAELYWLLYWLENGISFLLLHKGRTITMVGKAIKASHPSISSALWITPESLFRIQFARGHRIINSSSTDLGLAIIYISVFLRTACLLRTRDISFLDIYLPT
jgi:hypothetical protein